MTYIMVDVESDGPIPADYSMVCFGAIVVEPSLDRTFYGRLKPISDKCVPEALQICGLTRDETLQFDDAETVMQRFADRPEDQPHVTRRIPDEREQSIDRKVQDRA